MLYMLQHTLCFRREVEYIYVFIKKKSLIYETKESARHEQAGRQADSRVQASVRQAHADTAHAASYAKSDGGLWTDRGSGAANGWTSIASSLREFGVRRRAGVPYANRRD